jgi:histidinol-phosphate aminotransferase
MAPIINRRNWLKTSLLFTGALTLPSGLQKATAKSKLNDFALSDAEIEETILREEPVIKARLSANENPFGPSAKAKKAIMDAIDNSYRYAFGTLQQFSDKIAATEGVNKNQILLGAGSGPLLHAAAMYFSKGGGSIVSADPTYNSLPRDAEKSFTAKWVKVPLTPDYKHDLDAMEKAIDDTTSLVYLCNPNNPTGTVVDTAKLKAFCERVSKRVPIFIDEAYIDYLPDPQATTLIDCVKKGQNVIVARTFSKLHGFAGLRVGYMIALPEMITKLEPYCTRGGSISATSISAAIASYDDKEHLQTALKKTLESKEYLYKILKQEGYEYIPSSANFVMFPVPMDSQRFVDEMMKRGVSVRSWKFANKEWCRVSIGTMDEMKAFEDAFKQLS